MGVNSQSFTTLHSAGHLSRWSAFLLPTCPFFLTPQNILRLAPDVMNGRLCPKPSTCASAPPLLQRTTAIS